MKKHDGTTHGEIDLGPRVKTTMEMTDGELARFDAAKTGAVAAAHVVKLDASAEARRAKYLEDADVYEAQLEALAFGGASDEVEDDEDEALS